MGDGRDRYRSHGRDEQAPERGRPAAAARHPLLDLHDAVGNSGALRMLRARNQASEKRADRVADRAVSAADARLSEPVTGSDRPGGAPLPASMLSVMQEGLGQSLAGVRIHAGGATSAAADELGARAFTFGKDIVFGPGQLDTTRRSGRWLLAHEVAHAAADASTGAIHLKDKDDLLDVEVPEPEGDFELPFDYPWQNPSLRDTIYPFRGYSLRWFIETYEKLGFLRGWEATETPTGDAIDAAMTEMDGLIAAKKAEEKAAKGDARKVLKLQRGRLEDERKLFPKKPKKGWAAKKFSDVEKANWSLFKRMREHDAVKKDDEHEVFLARILEMFADDPDMKRYPGWLRYMVIHFSGMRYKGAHGSYAPSDNLLIRLKSHQIVGDVGEMTEEGVERAAAKEIAKLEAEHPGPKRAKGVEDLLARLKAVDTLMAAPFKAKKAKGATAKAAAEKAAADKSAAAIELVELEAEREGLYELLAAHHIKEETDPDDPSVLHDDRAFDATGIYERITKIDTRVEELGGTIGKADLKDFRKRLAAAQAKRRKALLQAMVERATRDIESLTEEQRIGVLKAMRASGAFPEWVWRVIVRKTALKLEAEDDSWEAVTKEEKTGRAAKDPVNKRWNKLISAWTKSITAWRKKHDDDLALVVIRAVCNEISEMSQHARGLTPKGGIGHNAKWYFSGKAGTDAKLIRPTDEADFVPGSTLFFMDFQDAPAKDVSNVVRSDVAGSLLQNEARESISDGFVDKNGWTYHFNPTTKAISRTRGPSATTDDPDAPPPVGPVQTQWLNWTHEATVVEYAPELKQVLTFETGPIGLRDRSLSSVKNEWKILLGSVSGSEHPELRKFIEDVEP